MTCECHTINWMARVQRQDKAYVMVDGSPFRDGVCCQDKVNDNTMDYVTYLSVCKYIPGDDGTLFPSEVYYHDMLTPRARASVFFHGDGVNVVASEIRNKHTAPSEGVPP